MSTVCKKIEERNEIDLDDEETAQVRFLLLFLARFIVYIFNSSVHKEVKTNANVASRM
jgi:hypothetical protein